MRKLIIVFISLTLALTACKNVNKAESDIINTETTEMTPDVLEKEALKGKEKEVRSKDSDNDGLIDTDEIDIGTDKDNPDTDGDGITDGIEIQLGLNPLSKRTDGKNLDNQIQFVEDFECDAAQLHVSGGGMIESIVFQKSPGVFNIPIALSPVYEIYMEKQEFAEADLMFEYDGDETNIGVYQYLDDGSYVLVSNGTSVRLEHFSRYFLGLTEDVEINTYTEIALVIDNSGSMYSKEEISASDENDVEFKRIDMAKMLVESADDNTRFSCYTFTGDITEEFASLSDKNIIYEKLDKIKENMPYFSGTASNRAVNNAIEHLKEVKTLSKKYIILISDGYDTITNYTTADTVRYAVENNIVIISIGLGNNIDVEHLVELASGTGGFYRYARSADDLLDLYEQVNSVLNNNYVDMNEDGYVDSILLADSGLNIEKDVFPFDNFRLRGMDNKIHNGQCYGIASFIQLYYLGKLPYSYDEIEDHKFSNLPWSEKLYAEGYSLEDSTFFESNNKVFIDNSKELVKYNDYSKLFEAMSKTALEKWEVNDEGVARYRDEVREIINSYPLTEIYTLNQSGSLGGKKFNKAEYFCFNLLLEGDASDEDMSMYDTLRAINSLFCSQTASGNDSFNFSILNSEEEGEHAMLKLTNALASGIPVIVTGEHHAINAVALYRDLDNPNEYKLLCYDNNYHNELKILTIKKIKTQFLSDGATSWTHDYVYHIYDDNGIYGKAGSEVSLSFDFARGLEYE